MLARASYCEQVFEEVTIAHPAFTHTHEQNDAHTTVSTCKKKYIHADASVGKQTTLETT